MMRVVMGLGNPGTKYEQTRHNIGFWVIDQLAQRLQVRVTGRRFHSLTGETRWADKGVCLVKPQTYMNESGKAAKALMTGLGVQSEHLLVVYDDLALPPGALRLRGKGSAGGHNGVRSIINYIGTESFPRLRIGIGAVPPGVPGAHYVLSKPTADEAETLRAAVARACDAILAWVEDGIERTMSRYNSARLMDDGGR